jgi:16S rRNA (cytidine1402-2'-O)-methyltransferase
MVVAKELTKTFERFISGSVQTIKDWFLAESAHTKGEFVFILPAIINDDLTNQNETHLLTILLAELPLKQAVKIASLVSNTNKNELYKLALELSKKSV